MNGTGDMIENRMFDGLVLIAFDFGG